MLIKFIFSAIVFGHALVAIADGQRFQLSDKCPPGFQLIDGACQLRSLYHRYDSLQGAGIGGLKTGLPFVRDGFKPQQIDLGRYLFFDPLMSRDYLLSCASCHHPDRGFSDGKALAVGITGQRLNRSTPSLWNIGFFFEASLGWWII